MRRRALPLLSGALLVALAGGIGCAAPPLPPPVARAAAEKPAPPAPTPSPAPAPEAESSPAAAAPAPGKPADVTDVVDPGGDTHPTVGLVQAAKAERERRAHAGEPVAVITDKSLPLLPKGRLTHADPGKQKATAAKLDGTARDAARDEQYWRGRAVDIRTRWRQAADEVKDLEQSAAGWRRRFYAENDPYVRDSQVKPEWDRVLDRLASERAAVEADRKELEDFLEEGRRAGALPGWLREGAEKEPSEDRKSKEPGTLKPQEPSIYRQPPADHQEDHGAAR